MSASDLLRAGTAEDRVDGEVPPQVAEPDSPEQFAAALKYASEAKLPQRRASTGFEPRT